MLHGGGWNNFFLFFILFYRAAQHLESYILLQSIWGVPPACGPLLQLATAQASQGNSPNLLQQNIGIKVTGHPVLQNSTIDIITLFNLIILCCRAFCSSAATGRRPQGVLSGRGTTAASRCPLPSCRVSRGTSTPSGYSRRAST